MNVLVALGAVIALVLIAYVGAGSVGLGVVFGVVIPYAALATFLIGVVYRVYQWATIPVPFAIATTAGQQDSSEALPFVKPSRLENPPSKLWVLGRMALEIFFFRSLFRNTRAELRKGPKLSYHSNEWLWLFGLLFHYSFLVIFIRHFRLFVEPTPFWVTGIESLDGLLQIGVPVLYLTDIFLLTGVTMLFVRRVWNPQLRYISLVGDYFPLLVIGGIATTGILLRYWVKVDVAHVKDLMLSVFAFSPSLPEGLHPMFFAHVFLVSVLIAYFPFSKLMHMPGVFMSPTRNLRGDSRAFRHVNPWNPKVKTHTYEEWEDEFRDKLKAVGLPVDRDEPSGTKAHGADKAEEE